MNQMDWLVIGPFLYQNFFGLKDFLIQTKT